MADAVAGGGRFGAAFSISTTFRREHSKELTGSPSYSLEGKHVGADRLINLHFFDLVLRQECSLGHLEPLGEREGNQDTFNFLKLRNLAAEGIAIVGTQVLHYPSRSRIDIEIGGVSFGVHNPKAAELLLIRQRRDGVTGL